MYFRYVHLSLCGKKSEKTAAGEGETMETTPPRSNYGGGKLCNQSSVSILDIAKSGYGEYVPPRMRTWALEENC